MGNRRSQSWWQTLRSSWRSWLLPTSLLVLLASGYAVWMSPSGEITIHYGQFKQLVREGNVKSVEMADKEISGELYQSVEGEHGRQGTRFRTARAGILEDPTLIPLLEEKEVEFRGAAPEPIWRRTVELMFLLLILGALLWFLLFRMEGPGSAFGFSRSRAKLHVQDARGVRFDGVAGLDEAVEELLEVVDFLRTPEKYQEIGGRIPKGVLLVGPPGTGKTLLARAVAGEANVPFLSMSGSDFVELFVGVGAARVRDLFKQALSHAPCIVFIDELDALGKARGVNVAGGGHEEREQTLNQLLVEMDGFDANKGVVLMAATNRPEILDAALLRPGRFDRTVVVDRPDVQGREKILRIHASTVRIADQVDLRAVAGLTPGFVGADLANLVNEAALLAARHGSPLVETRHFEEAIERGYVGLARKNRVMLPEEKRRIAYHECGHAIVSHALPTADPVHKISIIPRGVGAGGYVLHLPTEDRFLRTEDELRARLAVLLGGVTAEELVFGNVSTGPSNDYEHVSRVARSMVCQYGMSKNLGRMAYGPAQGSFLGHAEAGGPVEYSPTTAARIDEEVRALVDEAGRVARAILEDRRDAMDRLAALLLEKEVLDASQLHEVMAWVAEPAAPVPQSADSKGDDPRADHPQSADSRTSGSKSGDPKGFAAAS